MKRLNADLPAARNVIPRLEDGRSSQVNPARAERLPADLHRELSGHHVDLEASGAIHAFVNSGILPTTSSDANEVAGWCLEQGLIEHFTSIAASELTIWPTMDLEIVAVSLTGVQRLRALTFQELAIDEDAAHRIAAMLKALPSLEELSFYEADISSAGLEIISQALSPKLRILGIECGDVSRAMTVLAPALRDCSLEALALSFEFIANSEVRTLCSALAQNKTLQSLHLAGNTFDDGTPLAAMLRAQSSLSHLQLVRCKAAITLPVVAVLQENACRLRSLVMTEIDFEMTGEQDWYVSVANMLRVNHTLSALDLLDNDISSDSFERVGSALEGNRSLQKLALGRGTTVLPASSINAFIHSLRRSFGLLEFSMAPHSMTSEQCNAISMQLLSNRTRAVACSIGFMHGAGIAFAAAIPHQLPPEAGERISEHVFGTSTAEQFRAAGGPEALAYVNKSTSDAAVRQRSLEYRNAILHWLNEGDHDAISDLIHELTAAGVTILPEHMDGLLASANRTPGQLAALLAIFDASDMHISASQATLASLQKQAADSNDDALVAALVAAVAHPV